MSITDYITDTVAIVSYRVRRNPVLVGTAALWAVEALAAQDVLTWQGLVTVVAGFLVRSKTVPANEVWDLGEKLDDALFDALSEEDIED